MARTDPKDDKIAELELSLEAANAATAKAEGAAQQLPAMQAELDKLREELAQSRKAAKGLEAELTAIRDAASGAASQPTIKGLPDFAVQLRTSTMVTDAITGLRANAVAGSVLVKIEGKDPKNLQAAQAKVGGAATCYAVSSDEFESTKKSGRAF